MIIRLEREYKSLKSFVSEEIGDFTIITGRNGSGKSQLIQLIQNLEYSIRNNQSTSHGFSITPIQHKIQIEGIPFLNIKPLKGEVLRNQVEHAFSGYAQLKPEIKRFVKELLANGLNPVDLLPGYDFTQFMDNGTEQEKMNRLITYIQGTGGNLRWGAPANEIYLESKKRMSELLYNWRKSIILSMKLSKYKMKEFDSLTINDFLSGPSDETFFTNESPFTVQIENLFYGYARKRFNNEIEYNRKNNHNINNNSIPDSEFIRHFVPPWNVINEILKNLDVKLRVVEIKPADFAPEMEFSFYLTDIVNNKSIYFDDLSSGEKIIVGLIIRLFLTERYKEELQFPDCIVFDEPDAFLHPEMSNLLIDVFYKTFVKKLGIKVVFTTHSPSTVALAPEDCIFELINQPTTSLRKVTKDDALKILTGNLPLLSIDYKSHKQVFVESPTDQYYYQLLFNKLKSEKQTLFNLYFITIGYGKSNCSQVITLTKEIRNAGNRSSFGIIDWDTVNKEEEFILVHGFERRYSIENFILDPIYLAILFIEQGCANKISELGFDKTYNQYKLPQEDENRLGQIIQWFFSKIVLAFPTISMTDLTTISYYNGRRIKVPKWYLFTRGHDITEKLKKAFPSLNSFQNEQDLLKRLTEIMIKCYPFIPKESHELIINLSGKPQV